MGNIGGWDRFGDYGRSRLDRRQTLDDVDSKGSANRNPVADADKRFGGTVPQVTGLTLEQSPGAIEASWDPVQIADLKRYEIHVSDSAAFVDPSPYYRGETAFTYEEGTASTTYYFRVRAINTGDQVGEWSSPYGTAVPGAVTAADIADGSITEDKLADDAVTADKIAANAVGSSEIAAGAVDTSELASESVHTEDLTYTSGTVTNSGATELQWATENITSDGDEIKIFVAMEYVFNGGASDGSWVIRIRVGTGGGGSALYTSTIVSDDGTPGARHFAAMITHTPGSGSATYEATIVRTGGDRDITVANRTIWLNEIHR